MTGLWEWHRWRGNRDLLQHSTSHARGEWTGDDSYTSKSTNCV